MDPVEEGLQDYLDWSRGMSQDDKIHAFLSIRRLDRVKNIINTEADPEVRLAQIEEEVSKWQK